MDDSQQETISKLKFLGKISKGEKINVKELSLQTESWATSASRTIWFVDNRNNTMSFIQNVISAGFSLLTFLATSDNVGDNQLAKGILDDLLKAKEGINNLKTTYSDDTFFCCSIDTYIQSIKAKLSQLESTNPDLFTKDNFDKKNEKNEKGDKNEKHEKHEKKDKTKSQ